jgi:Uma2 family endonuclease
MSIASQTSETAPIASLPPLGLERFYTPEELRELSDDKLYELVDGRLVVKDMGAKSSWIASELNRHLGNFVSDKQLGRVWGADCAYQVFGEDANNVRRPDGSFIAKGRLENELPPDGHVRIAPDLAIEVVSPNDLAVDLQTKVDEYLEAGVRLIWVVYPESKLVLVYRAGSTVQRLGVEHELSGEDVLPEFRLAISKIFPVASEVAGE